MSVLVMEGTRYNVSWQILIWSAHFLILIFSRTWLSFISSSSRKKNFTLTTLKSCEDSKGRGPQDTDAEWQARMMPGIRIQALAAVSSCWQEVFIRSLTHTYIRIYMYIHICALLARHSSVSAQNIFSSGLAYEICWPQLLFEHRIRLDTVIQKLMASRVYSFCILIMMPEN